MPEENLIPITEIEGNFDQFMKIDNNKRIFFSGKFGIGKTYFLKDFFNLHKDEYEFFHLFPTNYQISTNEDIIELFKYDILIQLIKKDEDILKENTIGGLKDSTLLFYSWCKEKYSFNDFLRSTISIGENISDPIFNLFGKLGKPLKDLLELDKEFQEFKKEYLAGEKGLAEKYIAEIKSKNISETDYLSHLISEKITKLKVGKKSVLILDDMDRIDPDHIFRILNVFSAHFNDENNKFGFDAVIIVGDVKNIQSIFYHKYGRGTDFKGYFNKFYTIKPYLFDNKKVIAERIPYLVKQIKHEETNLKDAIGEGGYIKLLLSDILNRALILDKLDLRQLYKPIDHQFMELKAGVYNTDMFNRNAFQQMMDVGIKMLIAIFGGDKDFFVDLLKEIKENISDANAGKLAPYSAYSGSMIKTLINPKQGEKTKWNDYYVTLPVTSNGAYAVDSVVDGDPSVETKLFYDLLIDYVKKSKYSKNTQWEYDSNL